MIDHLKLKPHIFQDYYNELGPENGPIESWQFCSLNFVTLKIARNTLDQMLAHLILPNANLPTDQMLPQ